MASLTVVFRYNQSHYFEIIYYKATDSGPVECRPELRQGDTVSFVVDESVGGGVEVTFTSGSCFMEESFTVGGPTSPASVSVHTVSDSAPKKAYPFVGTAQNPAQNTARRKGQGRPPPWDAKAGELEVVTDPP